MNKDMRTLLRQSSTGRYCQGPDKWTDNPDRAYDFHFTDRALQYVETWHLQEVELAFAFDDPESVRIVPLDKTGLYHRAA